MQQLPTLIADLALILVMAGAATLLFKRLRQPLVLGYIVAGFLAGPHMPYTPTVTDTASIETWSQIGVVFLMFTLGLEFSFKKIVRMGMGPVIAACCVMFGMIGIGTGVGHLFSWGHTDSLFLGAMLAMSSTTIIYKALDDLGLRGQKFAGEVLSVLILEDILGILLMVALPAVAASRQVAGGELAGSLLKLGFFLVLWLIVGLYVVPTFLRRTRRWMNRETLLVVSLGLCFALVVAAASAGYSTAFGAFMMGSILAETVEAENIGRLVQPVRDLFGAVFFVSVGMMVDPSVLAQYWQPICLITLAILAGQALLGTGSFLLAGQPLGVAMRCGFSLAQIGEFAFIIAAMGQALGVTSGFLYPVVVAVSVVTTFLTPYMIRASVPAYKLACRLLPQPVRHRLGEGKSAGGGRGPASPWRKLGSALVVQAGVYFTLSVAVILLSFAWLLPACRALLGHWAGNAVCGLLTLLAASPFLRAIVMRKNHSDEFRTLRSRGRLSRLLLRATVAARFALAAAAVCYVLGFLSPLPWPVHVVAASLVVGLMVASKRVKFISIRMERRFLQNLRSREVKARSERGGRPGYAARLTSRNLHLTQLELPEGSRWGGRTLRELDFGRREGVLIAAVVRGTRRINIPDGRTQLFPGDRVEAIGDDAGLEAFARRMGSEVEPAAPDGADGPLLLRRLIVTPRSALVGQTLAGSAIRERFHCMVVGFEHDDTGTLDTATAGRVFRSGDAVWLVGTDRGLTDLARTLRQAERGAEAAGTPAAAEKHDASR